MHDGRKGQKGLLSAMIMFLELRKQTLPDPRRDARTRWAPANDNGTDNRQLMKTEEWSTFTNRDKILSIVYTT